MTVELRDETGAELDRQRLASDFATADEVVVAALRSLEEDRALAELRAKIAEGFAQIDRGEGLDGDEVFRELLAGLNLPHGGERRRAAGW